MRKILTLLILMITPAALLYAQNAAEVPEVKKPSRDFVMLQFNHENWANTPDSIRITGLGRGFNAYLCYDWPIQKSHFSFAAGVGIATANIYFQNQELTFADTGSALRVIDERVDYKKYKLTTAYAEAPFELRYFANRENRNSGFKAAIGVKVGALLGAHTKGNRTVAGSKVVDKVNTKRYMETWRFAGTLRLGYGNFSVVGTYNLTQLFKENQGPEVTPYSIGLCITGL